ncbi:MAG: triose-phosphate isomerase [Phycisphaerales bacterium]
MGDDRVSGRRPIVGGNWKMNTTRSEAVGLADAIASADTDGSSVEVVVFPPFPYLLAAQESIRDSAVALGAQDVYFEPNGAFTGEVSVSMLQDCGCKWVLCGHSERRHVLGEDDALINRKVRAARAAGLNVILCVGETLKQREAGETDAVNVSQLHRGLDGLTETDLSGVVIAYEPVWAIGTGRTASPADAQRAHEVIRATLAELCTNAVAERTRIQYGGSVKPNNAAELFAQPDIDGGLIGGASLKSADFVAIVQAAASRV